MRLVAAGDLLEAALERFDLERRLPVDLTQRRLAEVRDLGAGEAADEALRPGDPDLDIADLENDMASVEDDDARGLENCPDLVAMARVVVVVSEHGDDRDLDRPAGVREHLGLLGEPMRGQVAGEQDEIHLLPDLSRTLAPGVLEAALPAWMSPAAATRMVAVTELVIPAGGVPRTPKQGKTDRLCPRRRERPNTC